jgi:hypothetical protein
MHIENCFRFEMPIENCLSSNMHIHCLFYSISNMRIDTCEIANMHIERRIRGMHVQLRTASVA